jgi:hypothetical protein
MTGHIEALERLQRLRESGAITEAEFEREKASLLRAPAAASSRTWLWAAAAALALLLIALLVFLFWGRDDSGQPNTSPTANAVQASPDAALNQAALAPAPPTIRTRPQAEQLAAAFEAAFGRGGRAVRSVDGSTMTYTPAALRWIGERAVLLSAGRNESDCHACAGALAVHYLEAAGDSFSVQGEWLTGGGLADWGRAPEWRFSTELSDQPMLRTEGGGGNQGIFCSSVTYYEFGGNGPREVADIPIGYSNMSGLGGEDDGTEIQGRMRNIRRNVSFEVAYSGTRSFVERWARRGGRYVRSSGESQVPTC